jgi:prepilin-type N-terminal cleavage/methylation domain-containing protein
MKYKKIKNKKRSNGFTLIEVIIYISISSILLTGFIVSVFVLIDADKRVSKRALSIEEGHFALQKINWFVKNIDKNNFEVYLDSGRIWINRDNKYLNPLTSSRVVVENFYFSDSEFGFSVDGLFFKKKYENY